MKQNTKILSADRIPNRSIRHGQGFHLCKTTDKKTDQDACENKGGSDTNTSNIHSVISTTGKSHSTNSDRTFSMSIVHRLGKAWKHLVLCYQVSLERLQLSKLSDEQFDDLGLDRSSVHREARRRFFDIPSERE